MGNDRQYLSTFDIARKLDVSGRTVQAWAQNQRISGTLRVGGEYRFETKSVDAQLATGRFPKPPRDQ